MGVATGPALTRSLAALLRIEPALEAGLHLRRVELVFLEGPEAVAGVLEQAEARELVDAAVAGVGHAVPELAGDPAPVLVDHVPLDRVVVERAHRLGGEGLSVPAAHRLAPADPDAARDDHHRVLRVEVDELVPVPRRPAAPRDLLVVRPPILDLVPREARHHRSSGRHSITRAR